MQVEYCMVNDVIGSFLHVCLQPVELFSFVHSKIEDLVEGFSYVHVHGLLQQYCYERS